MKKLLLLVAIAVSAMANAQTFEWQVMVHDSSLFHQNPNIDKDGNSYILKEINSNSITINNATVTVPYRNLGSAFKEYALIKYDDSGNFVWARNISHRKDFNGASYFQMAQVTNNAIYILAYKNTGLNDLEVVLAKNASKDSTLLNTNSSIGKFFIKLDLDGYYVWDTYEDTEFPILETITENPIDGSINIVSSKNQVGHLLKKMDGNTGQTIYSKTNIVSGTAQYNNYLDYISDLQHFNNSSSLYCLSPQYKYNGTQQGFLTKVDGQGNTIASLQLPDEFTVASAGKGCLDEENNIYIVAGYQDAHNYMGKQFDANDSTFYPHIVLKVDSNLNVKWAIPVKREFKFNLNSPYDISIVYSNGTVYVSATSTFLTADNKGATGSNGYYAKIDAATGYVELVESLPPNYHSFRLTKAENNALYFAAVAQNEITIGSNTYTFNNGRYVIGKIKTSDNVIKGHVYYDLNNNLTQDAGENDVQILKVNIDDRAYFTNLDGDYSGTGLAGTNTVTPASLKYYTPSPTDYTVNFTTSDSTAANRDFRMVPIGNVNDLEVYITNVTFARPGFTAVYQALVRNVGTTTLSPTLKVNYDNRLDFKNAGPPESSHTGNELTWNITNLKPGDIKRYTMVYSIDTSIDIDDTLLFTASIIPIVGDTTPINNVDTLNHVVRGSYDPNIKEVNMPEIIDIATVNGSFPIEYTIHFQNTGTDTAFHVFLIDSLDNDLKIESLEILHASHNVEMSISENNAIRWDFNDILLVDSNTNEPMSHGFIRYRVYTKDNPGLGDEFTNFADIYFDFNAPIRTNTTSNRIDKIESVELVKGKTVIVYPNPSNGVFNIKVDINAGTNVKVEVIDLTGKLVHAQDVTAGTNGLETQVDINTLAQGIYFVRLYANNEVYTAKVVKE